MIRTSPGRSLSWCGVGRKVGPARPENLPATAAPGRAAGTPPLLAEAIQRWTAGKGDWAFTQETRTFLADGQVKEERIECYDPSLPDLQRWRLIEVLERAK